MKSKTLAALAALGALAALPGQAMAQESTVREYVTAKDAEAVKGAESSAAGPLLKASTYYTDSISPGEQRYYTVELDAKSTSRIAVVAAPKPGSKVAYSDSISVTLQSTGGADCDSGEADFGADGAARPMATYAARGIVQDGDCQAAGIYNVLITRESAATSDPDPWTIELSHSVEPGLKKQGATAAPDPDTLPSTPPQPPTSAAKTLEGGTGFNDAAGMGQGVWKDGIKPGDTHYYRVPVDWGQQLFTTAEFGTAAKVTDPNGYVSDGVRVSYFNPARGGLGGAAEMYEGDKPAAVTNYSAPIEYRNRYDSDVWLGRSSVSGWYYVAVTVHTDVAKFVDGKVPVTLRTSLKGTAQDGPAYDGDLSKAGFGVSDDDRSAAEDGKTADQAQESDSKMTLALAGIGAGVALLLGLGAWMLIARRRTPAPPAGPVQQYGPPQGY